MLTTQEEEFDVSANQSANTTLQISHSYLLDHLTNPNILDLDQESSSQFSSECNNKYIINLETVLFQEEKLKELCSEVSQNEVSQQNVFQLCGDWWEITRNSDAVFDIYKIFKVDQTRKNLRQSMVQEAIIIALWAYWTQCQTFSEENLSSLITILNTVRQNFLFTVSYIIQRMGNQGRNVWANALQTILTRQKILNQDVSKEMTANCEIIQSELKKLIYRLQKQESHPVLSAAQRILQISQKFHFIKAKSVLLKALEPKEEQKEPMCLQVNLSCNENILEQREMDPLVDDDIYQEF